MSSSIVKVTFESVATTRNIFEALSGLITDLIFSIVHTEDFTGIRVNSMCSKHICVIYIDLEATVENLPMGATVQICTAAKELSEVLKIIKEQNILVFKYNMESTTTQLLDILQYEQENSAMGQIASVKVLDAPVQDELDTDFNYPITCTIPMTEFKEIVSQSSKFGADKLSIMISRSTKQYDDISNYTEFITDGSVQLKKWFYTEHINEADANNFTIDNTLAMKDEPDGHNYNNILKCILGLSSFKDFIRPLDSGINVTLSMSNDMPIRLDYSISELSFITIFVSPRNVD